MRADRVTGHGTLEAIFSWMAIRLFGSSLAVVCILQAETLMRSEQGHWLSPSQTSWRFTQVTVGNKWFLVDGDVHDTHAFITSSHAACVQPQQIMLTCGF